tara:strand:+ start:4988 stop:5131 length:144 start_codon:yes stop_codon:yes gene_type:complete
MNSGGTRLAAKNPIFFINRNATGFIELDLDGHIGCAYILKLLLLLIF